MRSINTAGLVLGGIAVLAMLAAGVVAWRFDPASLREEIARAVYERKQRTLTIDGELALAFYPSLGVRLGHITLSEHGSAQEFASLDSARVTVRWLPLLSRQVVVDRVEMHGVRARIVRGKDGRFNFDDLLSPAPDKTATPATTGGQPIAFDIAGAQITNCAVLFRDETSGRTYQLDGLAAKIGRVAQAASGPIAVAFDIQSAQPSMKAKVELTGTYRYDLTRKDFALDKLAARIRGDVLAFKSLDASLNGTSAAWHGEPAGLQVQDIALKAHGQLRDDALDLQVQLPAMASAGGRTNGQAAGGTVRLAGPQRKLDAKLDVTDIEASAAGVNMGNVAVAWTFVQGTTNAQGHAAGRVRADLQAQTLALPKLTGHVVLASPQLPVKQLKMPLDMSAQVDWAHSRATGTLSTRVEDSAVQGRFQVSRFSPLATIFDAAIDRLDVDRYLPQTPATQPAQKAPAPAPDKQAPIDFSFLRGWDLRGDLRVGSLKARDLKFSDVAAHLGMQGGRLALSPMTAKLYGGTLAGSVEAQADGNRVALKQTLENVNIGELIRDYAHKDLLEGRGRLVLDVATGGASVAAMRQSLGGTARIGLHDGAVKGINLAKKLREGKAMLAGGGKESVVAADKDEKTDFSELTASFRIANGVARNDDLAAKSPFLRVAGGGAIDLVHEQIDYVVKATVVASVQGQQGKELADLKGVTVPVRLTGPYEHPTYRLELAELATSIARSQVQQRIEQQLGKQLGVNKGALGDVLKGLTR